MVLNGVSFLGERGDRGTAFLREYGVDGRTFFRQQCR